MHFLMSHVAKNKRTINAFTSFSVVRYLKDLPRKFGLYGKVFVSHGSRETIPEAIDMIDMERIVS